MPAPLLATLSAAARTAFPIIVGGVRQGVSANRIQSILKEVGIGVRRSTLLNIVAATRQTFQHGAYLRKLRKGQLPNIFALPDALTKTTRRFAFVLKVEGIGVETKLPMKQYVTLAMDKLMTREEMEALAIEIVQEGKERYEMEDLHATIETGIRKGPLGTL